MKVLIRTLLFTILIPGTVTVIVPRLLLPFGANFTFNTSGILGTLLIVLGATAYVRCAWNFTFSGKWYAAGFLVFAHFFVLLYEEPTLTKKFGPAYGDYRKTVPRWIPKLLPRRGK